MNRLEIRGSVCYVTSTFGNSTRYDTKSHLPVRSKNSNNKIHSKGVMISSTFKYATVRLAQQQTYTSNISPTCRVVGVNPSGLSGDNMGLYAKKMANMLYADFDDEQWNRIHCLQEESWYGHKIDNDDIVKMFNWALELEEQPQPQD